MTDAVGRIHAAFDAIDDADPAIFIAVCDRDAAIAAVDPTLPLAGTTFVAKNNIDIEWVPTTAGCPSYAYQPAASAPAVQRLIDAGATCLGATNLDQFATGLVGTRSPYGVPQNVIDPALIPGGSSSGSAVAVARGIADIGLGTDTAGSGRVPAAQNRIVGVKPTRGLVPTRGVVPAVRSLDCVSIFARDVSTAAQGLDVLAGFDAEDPWSQHAGAAPLVMPTLRVGVPAAVEAASDLDASAWRASVEQLAALAFVEIVEVDLDPFVEAGQLLYGGPWVAERYAAVGEFLSTGPAGADPTVAAIIGAAAGRTAVEAYEAQYRLAELRRLADHVWTLLDVIMMPTVAQVPPELGHLGMDLDVDTLFPRVIDWACFTPYANATGTPSISLPLGHDPATNCPVGMTFGARTGQDRLLLELALQLEQAQPWRRITA